MTDSSGTPCSDDEVAASVESYMRMLKFELAVEQYNKAEENRKLRLHLDGRPKGAVEIKHQNISGTARASRCQRVGTTRERDSAGLSVTHSQNRKPESHRIQKMDNPLQKSSHVAGNCLAQVLRNSSVVRRPME